MDDLKDAIAVLRDSLGVSLVEAAQIASRMSGVELDLVESDHSPVAVAALVYGANLRAARRIADPERRKNAVRIARTDAQRHHDTIRQRVSVDAHAGDGTSQPSVRTVYPSPPVPRGDPHA
jgi:hypothetical protein